MSHLFRATGVLYLKVAISHILENGMVVMHQ